MSGFGAPVLSAKLLLILMSFPLRCPSLQSYRTTDWEPVWTESADLALQGPTVGFLTHSSLKFDPLRATAPAVDRAVATLKSGGHEVVYLHDRYNPGNPAWTYLYSDWSPTAYMRSDIGHIDIDLSHVRHAVCLGGFYEQCERSTVVDLLRLWQRDAREADFRLTQVTDGVFTVLTYVRYGDWYEDRVRSLYRTTFRAQHPKAIITVDRVLQEIGQEEVFAEFLQRQLPPLPSHVNVVFDIYGVVYPWKQGRADAPTLTLAWRRADNILPEPPAAAQQSVLQRARPVFGSYPSGRVPPVPGPARSYPPGTIIRTRPSAPYRGGVIRRRR